jgi:hypothetical protein
MSPRLLLLSSGIALLLSACVAPQPIVKPILHQAQASRIDGKDKMAGKTYAITQAWNADGWTIKQGGMVSFQPDGSGVIELSIFDNLPTGKAERVHFYVHVFGKDGNSLFTLPNTDAGHVLHVHGVRKDCIHTIPFAYDARYFSSIERVQFSAGRDVPQNVSMPSGK